MERNKSFTPKGGVLMSVTYGENKLEIAYSLDAVSEFLRDMGGMIGQPIMLHGLDWSNISELQQTHSTLHLVLNLLSLAASDVTAWGTPSPTLSLKVEHPTEPNTP